VNSGNPFLLCALCVFAVNVLFTKTIRHGITRIWTPAFTRSMRLSNWALHLHKNLIPSTRSGTGHDSALRHAQGPGIYSVNETVELGLTFLQKLCTSTCSGTGHDSALRHTQGPDIYSVSEPVELGLTFLQKLCPSTCSGSGHDVALRQAQGPARIQPFDMLRDRIRFNPSTCSGTRTFIRSVSLSN
jgi:hypothetical protein